MMLKHTTLLSGTRLLQIVPQIVLIPYLLSIIGIEKYGFIAFWYGVSAFVANVVGLNMEVYAVREVFVNPNDRRSYAYPIFIKGALALIAVFSMCFVALTLYPTSEQRVVAIFSLYHVISVAFLPTHYFLGAGSFGIFFFSVFIDKFIYMIGVLIFVNNPTSYFYVPVIASVGMVSSICVSHLLIRMKFPVDREPLELSKQGALRYLKVSSVLLIGKITQLHTVGARGILGIFTSSEFVGIYDILEKIISLMRMPISVLAQARYSRLGTNKLQYALEAFLLVIVSILIVYLANLFFPWAVKTFLPTVDVDYAKILFDQLSLIVLALPIISIFGTNYIMKNMEDHAYGIRLICANFISIIVLLFLIYLPSPNEKFIFWVLAGEFVFATFCLVAFLSDLNVHRKGNR